MANRDALKEVLLQLKNLKLSSPLRADHTKDDNKENILAGQDNQISKTEEKSKDVLVIANIQDNTPDQLDCDEIDVNSYGKSEGSPPATSSITSLVSSITVKKIVTSEDNLDSVNHTSESFTNETVSSEVNYFGLFGSNQADHDCTLTNCVQEASTQSLYDDCVDPIGISSAEYANDLKSSQKVSDDLNSTYAVEELFESLQETEELFPVVEASQSNSKIESNIHEKIDIHLSDTQIIEEGSDTKIIKDEESFIKLSGTLDCEIAHENSDIISEQSERCNHLNIETFQNTKPLLRENTNETFKSESAVLPAKLPGVSQLQILDTEKISVGTKHCEDFDDSFSIIKDQHISRQSSDSEESLLDITKINCSIENLEKSTAKLVSDSSNGSLNTSLNSTNLSESLTNVSNLHGPTSKPNLEIGEVNSASLNQEIEVNSVSVKKESSEKLDLSISDCTTQVVNKSSSAFIVLTPHKPEHRETFSETISTSSSGILGQPSPELNSHLAQSSNLSNYSTAQKQVEQTNYLADGTERLELSSLGNKDGSTTLAEKVVERQEDEKNFEETENIPKRKMEEISDKLQQEFSDTKLELNAIQQAKATLELEISKKDEIILKTQAEAMKKEQQYIQEIKVLKEQLKEKAENINEKDLKVSKDSLKDLEEALKEAKAKEVDVMKVLEEYEKTIATRFADYKKLKEENATVNRHLSNLELSFSDLHQKYEKAKSVIYSYKKNEEKLRNAFAVYDETFLKQEGRYESLKAHAQTQIDKCNIEILQQKEKSDGEISKLKAIVKRLEIKIAALETSLEQKTKECIDLAALCDEVTGKKF